MAYGTVYPHVKACFILNLFLKKKDRIKRYILLIIILGKGNWLVAAKSSYRRCFLILRCRLFLSLRSRIRQALDCSPTNRERELGLDSL